MRNQSETTVQNLAQELHTEVNQRMCEVQAIEVELQKALKDVYTSNLADGSNLSHGITKLEQILRIEVQSRMNNEAKLKERIESVIVSLSKAMEVTQSDSITQITKLNERLERLTASYGQFVGSFNDSVDKCVSSKLYSTEIITQDLESRLNAVLTSIADEKSDR